MDQDLYFITGNKNKYDEARSIIPRLVQLDIDLPEIQSDDPYEIIAKKLCEAHKHHDGAFIVEDTSLYFNCLNGLPGPLVKWFLMALGTDGLYDLVSRYDDRGAQAKTIIGYSDIDQNVHFFEGIVYGKIVVPHGDVTFGWDPIFMPDGHKKTFAQMSREEKNAISMRKIACKKLQDFL